VIAQPRLMHHAFERTALSRPDHTAVVAGEQRVTFASLSRQARQLAGLLQRLRVQQGDRVIVALDAGPAFATACFATWMVGAVFVPLQPTAKPKRKAQVLADSGASALVVRAHDVQAWRAACSGKVGQVRAQIAVGDPVAGSMAMGWCSWTDDLAPDDNVQSACTASDLAALLYTSGSTGEPKGVMLTHANMTAAWDAVQTYLQIRPDDVIGLALSPCHSYGLYNLLMGLGIGATVMVENQAAFPLKVLQTFQREQVTVFPAVPTLLARLLDCGEGVDRSLPALRIVTNAAAPLSITQQSQVRERWPQARLFLMYGLTECKRASYLDPADLDARPGSVGRGIPNQVHWLVDEDGNHLPDGSLGELVVSGPHVMQGYWQRPEATAQRLRPDRETGRLALHTGDVFRSDAQGFLYFVGRNDDLFKSSGEKVAPRQVEETIHQLPQVATCAVIGVPDPGLGQAIKAFVVLKSNATLTSQDLVRHCRERLEAHLVPKHIEFREALPHTDSGKIRHAQLRLDEASRLGITPSVNLLAFERNSLHSENKTTTPTPP
jgi:long-chain acyl-CoA synthetase